MSRARAARGPLRGASTPILIGVLVSAAGVVGALIITAAMTTKRVRTQTAKGRECLGCCTVPPFLPGNILQSYGCVVYCSLPYAFLRVLSSGRPAPHTAALRAAGARCSRMKR